jgi:hypothetical protein
VNGSANYAQKADERGFTISDPRQSAAICIIRAAVPTFPTNGSPLN